MRLLECINDGDFSLTTFLGDNIPQQYAILSHTWEAGEVTFVDLINGTGKKKAGYDKIRFCGEQARRDGLRYFWVDTCCIDKSNSTELAEAINSMFRWYREAAKCYVYLSDVETSDMKGNSQLNEPSGEATFRKSRWFTRGWTLQELVAPALVEFFSKEGELLGNKGSLEQCICEVTGIPTRALRGSPLSGFSVTERMSWAEQRVTTIKEDIAYSLLGIFDVHMPLIYGEGKEHALKRLHEEIDKVSKGVKREDFSVTFSLAHISGIEHFVARERELEEMHRNLISDGSRRVIVLHGLGGIGKTQLTVAYAKRHKANYSGIFWLNIKDEYSLKQSFAGIARQILREHPSASRLSSTDINRNMDEVIDAVKVWLSLANNTRWLMIYDNYDNPKSVENADPAALEIQKFLPEAYHGSVIVTTRSSQVTFGHRIQVQKLSNIADGLDILAYTSRREGLKNDPGAVKLARELDGFPLALATAGAYLDQVALSPLSYLRLYKDSWASLQKLTPKLTSYEDRTLYSTWQISFEHVQKRNELSAKLLCFWAYFDNQDLWFELLRHSNAEDPIWVRELANNELSFHDAVRVLCDYGLVEVDTTSEELIESRGYNIHACVHSWTIHVLNQEWDKSLATLAVKLIGSHVPSNQDLRPWVTQRRLLQHTARCSYMLSEDLVEDGAMTWVCHNLGLLYLGQSKLGEAEKMYQQALKGKEKALGAEHTSTLNTIISLGNLYTDQGKLGEAEKMYQQALQGYEKALGAEHTSTLGTINNLGNIYTNKGRLDEAEKMYQRALQGKKKVLGAEHISTLETINSLANLYKDQGKLGEAEKMYQQALQGFENALGAEHTLTLSIIGNLGLLYVDQGKLSKAEKMCQQALQGYDKALGAEHTSTLGAICNLGSLYKYQGKLGEAEKMYQQALRGYEKALGAEHISTLGTICNLGNLYADQGKLGKAEEMYQRALQGYKNALGANFETYLPALNTIHNLGNLYADQGKLGEAEEMYQRALQGYKNALGANFEMHLPALNTTCGIASLFECRGDVSNARILYSKALHGYKNAVGSDHPGSKGLQDILRALDAVEDNASEGAEEPPNTFQ